MQNWHSMEIRQRSGVHGKRRDLERSSTWILARRSEEHTSELQSPCNLVCRLLLEKKKISRHQELQSLDVIADDLQSYEELTDRHESADADQVAARYALTRLSEELAPDPDGHAYSD